MSANMPTPPASRSMLEKPKVMIFNTNTNQPISSTEGKEIESLKSFTYLGAILTNTRGGTIMKASEEEST